MDSITEKYRRKELFNEREILEIMGIDKKELISMIKEGKMPPPRRSNKGEHAKYRRHEIARALGYDLVTKKEAPAVNVTVKIKNHIVARLDSFCKGTGCSRRAVINRAIDEYIKRNTDGD